MRHPWQQSRVSKPIFELYMHEHGSAGKTSQGIHVGSSNPTGSGKGESHQTNTVISEAAREQKTRVTFWTVDTRAAVWLLTSYNHYPKYNISYPRCYCSALASEYSDCCCTCAPKTMVRMRSKLCLGQNTRLEITTLLSCPKKGDISQGTATNTIFYSRCIRTWDTNLKFFQLILFVLVAETVGWCDIAKFIEMMTCGMWAAPCEKKAHQDTFLENFLREGWDTRLQPNARDPSVIHVWFAARNLMAGRITATSHVIGPCPDCTTTVSLCSPLPTPQVLMMNTVYFPSLFSHPKEELTLSMGRFQNFVLCHTKNVHGRQALMIHTNTFSF